MSLEQNDRRPDVHAAGRAIRRLEAVQAVTDVALAGLPMDKLLPALLDRVRAALRVDNAALLLLDEDGQTLHMRAVRGPEEAVAAAVRVPYGQGFAGHIASERKPWVVDDISTIEVVNPFLQQTLRSVVGVPLEVDGRVIGVVHVGTTYRRHFTPEDVALLELVAERAARVIDVAHLREAEGRMERALAENERRFRAIFEQAAVGMAEVALDGSWLRVNDKLCQIVGYPREELLARTFQDITYPPDLDADLALMAQLLAGEIPTYALEKRYLRRDGSLLWINLTVALVRNAQGAPDYFISVVEDVSARKAADEALRASEARQRTLIATLPQLIWTMAPDGTITFANTRWLAYLGRDAGELVGADMPVEIVHPDDRERTARERERALATGAALDFTLRYRRHDGVYRWHALRIEPLRDDASGAVTGWYGAATDIDDLKRAQAALAAANETLERRVAQRTAQLQEANDELEAFAYSVSHDLRAPLRAMGGFAQALAEDYAATLDETAQMYTRRIVAAAARMEGLIQDLLAYSRLTREEIIPRPVELDAVVAEALASLAEEIRARGAEVSVEGPLPVVLGNRTILRQVVANLVGNALTYVAPGVAPRVRMHATSGSDVDASASVRSPSTPRGMARLWIEDNGIGVAPQHHERIFRVFERLHSGEDFPGTGIGLAIVKKGIERLGGRVGLESAPGAGARFWIELPCAPASQTDSAPTLNDQMTDAPPNR